MDSHLKAMIKDVLYEYTCTTVDTLFKKSSKSPSKRKPKATSKKPSPRRRRK